MCLLPKVSVVDSSVTWGYIPPCLSEFFRHPQSLADGLQSWTKVILVVIHLVSRVQEFDCSGEMQGTSSAPYTSEEKLV